MSVRHTAGTVFKAFAAHVTVFFVRMADFALTVLRVPRNVVAVMMFMSAAAAFFVFMVMMFPTATAFSMLMFVVVLMFFTAAGSMFMFFMSMSFAAAARFVMAMLVFRLMAVFMVMVTTTASPIFMVVVMRKHFIAAVSYIR